MEDTAVQDALDTLCVENDKDDLFIEWGKEAMIQIAHLLLIVIHSDNRDPTVNVRLFLHKLISRKITPILPCGYGICTPKHFWVILLS